MSKHANDVARLMKDLEQAIEDFADGWWIGKPEVKQELKDDAFVNTAVKMFKTAVARQVTNRLKDVEPEEIIAIKNSIGDICTTVQSELWRELKSKYKPIEIVRG